MSSSTASKLDSLVGLDSAKRLVLKLSRGEVGTHAVLFYGIPGSGKNELARMLAQAWLCQTPGADGADGTCRACLAYERGNSADLLSIHPTGNSRNIVTKQITRPNDKKEPKEDDPVPLREFFRTLPLIAKHKVAMIEDAHRMNNSAASALLKTLEEPHPHAKLILTTDSVGGVLPTILSRCLAVACELPEHIDHLDPELVRLIEGAPGRAKLLANKPDGYRRLVDFAKSLPSRLPGSALVTSEDFRSIAEKLGADHDLGARAANTLALELLATYLARESGIPAHWPQEVIRAHKWIVGNANATLVFDALFAGILAR